MGKVKTPSTTGHGALQAPQLDWANGQKVSVGGASAQSSSTIGAEAVLLISDTACFIKLGSNPTAADAAGSTYLPADTYALIGCSADDKVAVIQSSAAGSLYVLPVDEA